MVLTLDIFERVRLCKVPEFLEVPLQSMQGFLIRIITRGILSFLGIGFVEGRGQRGKLHPSERAAFAILREHS